MWTIDDVRLQGCEGTLRGEVSRGSRILGPLGPAVGFELSGVQQHVQGGQHVGWGRQIPDAGRQRTCTRCRGPHTDKAGCTGLGRAEVPRKQAVVHVWLRNQIWWEPRIPRRARFHTTNLSGPPLILPYSAARASLARAARISVSSPTPRFFFVSPSMSTPGLSVTGSGRERARRPVVLTRSHLGVEGRESTRVAKCCTCCWVPSAKLLIQLWLRLQEMESYIWEPRIGTMRGQGIRRG
jgi:hypothetical protein